VIRKHISILVVDNDGFSELVRWDLFNAWPASWRGAPLDAQSREVAIESLTIVCDSLARG
jgi:phage tail-like protein